MYHHLRGHVVQNLGSRVVLETGGVGWELVVPLSTSRNLSTAPNRESVLLTHFSIREDAHVLYGFLTEDERTLFRHLIDVSGIGPTSAIQILSYTTPAELLNAIERQDAVTLRKIKGIGEKTAKRIILEMKGKIAPSSTPGVPGLPAGVAADAVGALVAMGVGQNEARARVEKALGANPDLSLEDLIRKSLQG